MPLNNILGKPLFVEDIGEIYPIKMKDYDQFVSCSYPLYYSKAHFKGFEQYPLLDLLVEGVKDPNMVPSLEQLFSLVTKKEVRFVSNDLQYGFVIDANHVITNLNYDNLRTVVMKQNILHEEKVYENPIVREWAQKVMKAKIKNAPRVGVEEMLSTVSVVKGIPYDVLLEQTYYQLYADFKRIYKIKAYEASVQAAFVSGSKNAKIENFAEEVNMYENPYDNLFVDKNRLNSLNSALQ